MPVLSASEWEAYLGGCPNAHLLQTAAWGELKSAFGWQPVRLVIGGLGAQVLFRRLPLGFSLAYLPRGPVWTFEGGMGDQSTECPSIDASNACRAGLAALWPELDRLCWDRRAVFLKLEPDWWEQPAAPAPPGLRLSRQSVQPPRTLLVDLRGDEDHLLGRMKQKTRYNIRLALKKGVIVRLGAEIETFYHLMQQTGQRDGFGIHSLAYYRRAYELFHPRGACELLLAEYEHQPLAGLMVFAHGRRAWYLFGASADTHRDLMPTYLLQWEAMRWARAQGCATYDLWGVPDADEQSLEAGFTLRSDGLWGVYRNKRGFGGQLLRSAGPWDRVYRSLLYRIYGLAIKNRQLEQ
jgi:peptidoglycan pentaglycine glycine transferase (the first glycine)